MERASIVVRSATTADHSAVAATLARAFAADPALSYIFPEPDSRPVKLRRFFELMLRSEADPALTDIAGDNAAAAVWRAPGQWRTTRLTMLRLALPMLAAFGRSLPRALRVQALLEAHHPAQPHWYLELLGCDPLLQGKGYGGAATRARLQRCDDDQIPAALETATASNVPLYAALGFAVTGQFDVPGGPRFWSLWREPR